MTTERETVLLEDEVLGERLQMENRLFSFAEKVRILHLLKEAKDKGLERALACGLSHVGMSLRQRRRRKCPYGRCRAYV